MSAPPDDRPRPKVRVSKSGRKRIDVPDLIARLERHVQERRVQLERESKRNTEAKRRLGLLTAVSCGSKALYQLLAADPGDAAARAAAAPDLATFDAECRALGAMLLVPEACSGGDARGSGNAAVSSSCSGDVEMAGADGGDQPAPRGEQQLESDSRSQQRQGEDEVDQEQGQQQRSGHPHQQQQRQQQQQQRQVQQQQVQQQQVQQQQQPPPQEQPHEQQQYNSVGLSPQELIESALAMRGDASMGVERFTEDHHAHVRDLAVLLHQQSRGAAVSERLQASMRSITQRLVTTLLYHPAAMMRLLNSDLETGEMGEPDPSVWDRCATSLALDKEQAETLSIVHFFWQSTSDAMRAERQALAQRGSEAPGDLALQESVVEGLERVQRGMSVMTVVVITIMMTSLLTPRQGAEIIVQAWPRMPLLLGLLEAIHRLYVASQPPASS
ncbi:hypothetical protein Rsub_11043 [Raphidocelis subcapitata]|uniref:Uncharacterized protein n=1 Tax=Raphidocelis subcapitata TaxID=307507 RepID=A0A2V0PJQ8_9CHLO|nr:hypothetical protein Rsub_11043 [Raphidocelis subcapitata]|eukprot:GBF98223.1 hypothetical protein Rsub_11043 [Raphidocelis subcapitata]